MKKMKSVLKKQFDVDTTDIFKIYGGLSAMNYKIITAEKPLFLKVYDKKKVQTSLWTENINCYMPILVWLNENTDLQGRIVRPLKTDDGAYRFDDDENVYLLFEFIKGEAVGKTFTHTQLLEAAEIMACLHRYDAEIPANTDKIREDFSVPFCFSLDHFLLESYATAPTDIKAILKPYRAWLLAESSKVKLLSEMMKQRNNKMVLCHTDAHGYNFMQSDHLILVDWEGIKLSPAEADLFMFSKKEYLDIFIERYMKLRPEFKLDKEIFEFYILRRKIEDIWAFIESILYDDLTEDQRKRDLGLLSNCCDTLDNMCFEL